MARKTTLLMGDKITFVATLTSEVTKSVSWEVDAKEFSDWAGGEEPTPELIKDFLQSGRDREEIEEEMWNHGSSISGSSSEPFVNIEKVVLS